MFLAFIPAALYICASLIAPLRWAWPVRLILMLLLLIGAFRAQLLSHFWPGPVTILPEAPREIMIIASTLFTSVLVLSQLTLLRDLLIWLWILLRRQQQRWRDYLHRSGILVLILGSTVTGYCMWQSMRLPEVREQSLTLPTLPAAYDGLRVAFLADLHLSPINDVDYCRGIVERVNALKPDLILIPGDLADGTIEKRMPDLAPLADLRARYGVYVTTGNHEYYSGYKDCMQAYRQLGLKVLENEHTEILPQLTLIGVTDYAGIEGSASDPRIDLRRAKRGIPEGNTRILLGHHPAIALHEDISGIDLHLAGHSHGGMMPGPLEWFTNYAAAGRVRGLYQVDETQILVTTGAGTWPGAMFRLHVPSEILLLHLKSGKQKEKSTLSHE